MKYIFLIFLLCFSSIGFSQSEYPYDEPIDKITGLIVPRDYKPSKDTLIYNSSISLPDVFDWREKGLTPVENQGLCGSCYAFATTSVLEDVIKIKTDKEIDLSEQYLLDCSYKNGDSYGCDGGWQLHDYHMKDGKEYQGGIDGTVYPYSGTEGTCREGLKPIDEIVNWKEVSNDVNSIKYAIMTYGPVWSTVYVENSFQAYRKGYYCGPSGQSNHAVTLVGWTKNGWILKNSWGSNWGENGYMEIGFSCNNVGFATNHVIYDPEPLPPDPDPEPDPDKKFCDEEKESSSKNGGRSFNMVIRNVSGKEVEIFWLDFQGKRQSYGTLSNRKNKLIRTYLDHVWVVTEKDSGNCKELFEPKRIWDRLWIIE